MSSAYPVFLNLASRLCIVVGGGAVAERKVLGLLDAGARVRVVSPDFTPMLRRLIEEGAVEAIEGAYSTDHLDGAVLVYAATNRRDVNRSVAQDGARIGVLVNSADSPDEGAFVVPSVVRRGDLCIAVSTGGNHPAFAGRIARELESRFGPEYAEFVALLGTMRERAKASTDDMARRKAAASALMEQETEIRALLREQRGDEAALLAAQIVARAVSDDRLTANGD